MQEKPPLSKPSSNKLRKEEPSHSLAIDKAVSSKQISAPKSFSRSSFQSIENNRQNKPGEGNSKVVVQGGFGCRYTLEMEKLFPPVNLKELTEEKINKLNEKLRVMIRKFNEELSDMINKNVMLLRSKKVEKPVTVDERLRMLEEQCRNSDMMIDVMEK
jgi:hypothetical protein